jgi:hypothetical protein
METRMIANYRNRFGGYSSLDEFILRSKYKIGERLFVTYVARGDAVALSLWRRKYSAPYATMMHDFGSCCVDICEVLDATQEERDAYGRTVADMLSIAWGHEVPYDGRDRSTHPCWGAAYAGTSN